MALYLKPKTNAFGGTPVFNISDFNYQDESISFKDAVTLTSDQLITGKKEFIQQIKTASIINSADLDVNGTTTLVDININGNCVIGDQSSDTLTVNCTNPIFTDSVTILGVSSLENVNVQNLNVAQSLYFNSQSETPLEFGLVNDEFTFGGNIRTNAVSSGGITDTGTINANKITFSGTLNGKTPQTLSYLDATSSIQNQMNSKHPNITSDARLDTNLIADGTVSNTVFPYIKNLTSDAQEQITSKHPNITSSARLNANLIADGTVSNTVFPYIKNLTSDAQEQITSRHPNITSSARLNANLIADGTVSNTVFPYIKNLSSDAQQQITSINNVLPSLAPLSGANLTNNPTCPTQPAGNSTTRIATTEFVTTAVSNNNNNTTLTGTTTVGSEIVSGSFAVYGNTQIGNQNTDTLTVFGPTQLKNGLSLTGGTATGITKAMVGLSNVDNTSDANKPISTLTQTQLNLKANASNAVFTGTTTGITKAMVGLSNVDNTSDAAFMAALLGGSNAWVGSNAYNTVLPTSSVDPSNSYDLTTKKYVDTAIANLVGSAPSTMDTLNEISASLANDPNFATTMTTALGNRMDMSTTQTVGGAKTFSSTLTASGNSVLGTNAGGNTLTVYAAPSFNNGLVVSSGSVSFPATSIASTAVNNTTFVDMANTQTITGGKTFSTSPIVPTPSSGDSTTKAANTAFVTTAISNNNNNTVLTGITKVGDEIVNGGLTVYGNTQLGNQNTDTITMFGPTELKNGLSLTGGSVTGITKSMIGLSNVDNTTDVNKPISTVQQAALDLKANSANPTFTGTVAGITAAMIGLSNVDNTSDVNKPVSTAQQTALNLKANLANPTFSGTVSGITAAMVGLGNCNNTSDVNKPVSTAQQTALNLKANLANPTFSGTVSGISSTMVGLGNCNNTSDANKPVSTAQQTALNLKADLADPTFSGTVSAAAVTASGLVSVPRISESIGTATISSNSVAINYANGAIHYLTGLSANTNFAVVLTNVNPNNASYKTFTITLIIDSTTYKAYCNSCTINGTSRTIKFNGTPDVSTATSTGTIMQQISVIYTASTTVPYCVVSNCSVFA